MHKEQLQGYNIHWHLHFLLFFLHDSKIINIRDSIEDDKNWDIYIEEFRHFFTLLPQQKQRQMKALVRRGKRLKILKKIWSGRCIGVRTPPCTTKGKKVCWSLVATSRSSRSFLPALLSIQYYWSNYGGWLALSSSFSYPCCYRMIRYNNKHIFSKFLQWHIKTIFIEAHPLGCWNW